MGEVYLAEDTQLNRLVALKVLPAEIETDDDRVLRFVQEAKAASALNHPNILTVHEIGDFEGSPFISTEYIKGETLRDRLNREFLTLRETLEAALQVAAALSVAHDAGIVHRDIKPENIMIRDDGLVKVLDFGLAKLTEKKTETSDSEDATRAQVKTSPGLAMGTSNYMSPEQMRGKNVDERSDIWSLGVVLYEMLTRRKPFAGETMNDTVAAILTKEPEQLDEAVPFELQRIIKKSLQKQLEERYQTVKDFAIDVKSLKRELEFHEELERSNISAFTNSRNAATMHSGERKTSMDSALGSTQKRPAHQSSSAEYLILEARKHRFVSLTVLGILLAAILGAGFYYWYPAADSNSINSVAVLPFANVGNDPNNEYLSDGLSESLINNLSQLPQLKVIARSSAFQYKGKEIDPQEVAKALGVQVIVTGRVTQRGDNLNISVEMINAADKTQMWGETYNRKAADAQNIQEEIARTVTERLRLKLSGTQEQQLAKQATQNPQAYQLYLNGLFHRRNGGPENVRKALDYNKQALALDPKFAQAHVGVADAYRYLGGNGLLDPQEAIAKAKEEVQKALALDETLAEAHVTLAGIKQNEWEWEGAERELKRAVELNPSLAMARRSYALHLSLVGRPVEAIAEVERAQGLDPLDPRTRVVEGQILYHARRYDEAIQRFYNVLKIEPDYTFLRSYLGYAYAAKGQYDEAIAEYQRSMSFDGGNSSDKCYLGHALAMTGRRDEALEMLDKLKATREYVAPAELAFLYAGLGDKEQALASLEKAYAVHDLQLQYLKVDPHYDSLRADLRFADLLRRIGLPQ